MLRAKLKLLFAFYLAVAVLHAARNGSAIGEDRDLAVAATATADSGPSDEDAVAAEEAASVSRVEVTERDPGRGSQDPSRPLQACLGYYFQEPENAATRSPWGLMHAAIGFGVDTKVVVEDRIFNTLGWLCGNGSCAGQRLMTSDEGGLSVAVGPGYQGHEGQFLSVLAQARVPADFGLKIDQQTYQVQDLIEYEKRTCRAGSELTFKLIGLAHYLRTDASWTSDDGQQWNVARLIEEELAQSVVGAACGGTHRMTGFSRAVRARKRDGAPMDGHYLRAEKYIHDYLEYTFKLQNENGSFSTNWFAGRGDWGGIDLRMQTTGHVLEWLVYALPEADLSDPRVRKAVEFLTDLLLEYRSHDWEIGPLGHALHALALYDERVFGRRPGHRKLEVSEQTLAEVDGERNKRLAVDAAWAPTAEVEPPRRPGRRLRRFRR